jgi:peroxiredoxin
MAAGTVSSIAGKDHLVKSSRSRLSRAAVARPYRIAILAGVLLVALAAGIVPLVHGRSAASSVSASAAEAGSIPVAERMALPAAAASADTLRLGQLRGSKVVLYFYEGASCGPCQQQLIELQQSLAEIQHLGARVVAVSVDPIETSRSLASQLRLGFPILQDVNHELGTAFGVFRLPSGMDMGPVDSHSILILDQKGQVSWKELAPQTMHVPVGHVLAALKR